MPNPQLGAGVSGNGQRHHWKPESCLRKQKNVSLSVQDVPEKNPYKDDVLVKRSFFLVHPEFWFCMPPMSTPGGFRQKLMTSFILVQVTAVFPYIILIIFFVRAMGLRGMEDGVRYLFTPKVTFPWYIYPPDYHLLPPSGPCSWIPPSGWRRGHRYSSLSVSRSVSAASDWRWLLILTADWLFPGSLIAYSSYNPVNNNCIRQKTITVL